MTLPHFTHFSSTSSPSLFRALRRLPQIMFLILILLPYNTVRFILVFAYVVESNVIRLSLKIWILIMLINGWKSLCLFQRGGGWALSWWLLEQCISLLNFLFANVIFCPSITCWLNLGNSLTVLILSFYLKHWLLDLFPIIAINISSLFLYIVFILKLGYLRLCCNLSVSIPILRCILRIHTCLAIRGKPFPFDPRHSALVLVRVECACFGKFIFENLLPVLFFLVKVPYGFVIESAYKVLCFIRFSFSSVGNF